MSRGGQNVIADKSTGHYMKRAHLFVGWPEMATWQQQHFDFSYFGDWLRTLSHTSCSTVLLMARFEDLSFPPPRTTSALQTSVLHKGHLLCLSNQRSMQAWWKTCPQAGRRLPASSCATTDKHMEHSSPLHWEPEHEGKELICLWLNPISGAKPHVVVTSPHLARVSSLSTSLTFIAAKC